MVERQAEHRLHLLAHLHFKARKSRSSTPRFGPPIVASVSCSGVNHENVYLRDSPIAFTMGYYYNYEKPAPVPEPWDVRRIIMFVMTILALIFTLVESVLVLKCVASVLIVCLVLGGPPFALMCMFGDL